MQPQKRGGGGKGGGRTHEQSNTHWLTAKQTTTARRTLRREERGPRKATNEGRNVTRGGGGMARSQGLNGPNQWCSSMASRASTQYNACEDVPGPPRRAGPELSLFASSGFWGSATFGAPVEPPCSPLQPSRAPLLQPICLSPLRRPQRRLDRRLEEVSKAGWGRLLSVTNAIEAGTWRHGHRLGALEGGGGTSPPSNAFFVGKQFFVISHVSA